MRSRKTNSHKRHSSAGNNHGSCEVCEGNRLHSAHVRIEAASYADPPPDYDYFDPWESYADMAAVFAPELPPVVVALPLAVVARFRRAA